MKTTLLAVFFLPVIFLRAQFEFGPIQTYLCADGVTEISAPENWQVYQTLDGTFYGEVDVTQCINMGPTGDIDLLECDTSL
ncbi:MAG: hypothetical protein JNM00_05600, partial [Flavobacteriales bacterium]|nr:hypothetical protein [Flavobacteriales bacterium]